jgi:hypothetical protein
MGDEHRFQMVASRLIGASSSGSAALDLPSLNAQNASELLHHLCHAISARQLNDSDAMEVAIAVRCLEKGWWGGLWVDIKNSIRSIRPYSVPLQVRAQGHQHHCQQLQVRNCSKVSNILHLTVMQRKNQGRCITLMRLFVLLQHTCSSA